MRKIAICAIVLGSMLIGGCGTKKEASTANDREFTLGLVQKEIRKGMSQAEVAEAIGSPNIVTKDSEGKESWIYDKMASEASYSHKDMYWTLILIGGSRDSGKSSSSQRTLTVVIKFNAKSQVETLSYHSSKF